MVAALLTCGGARPGCDVKDLGGGVDQPAVSRAGRWPKQQARRQYVAFLRAHRGPLAALFGLTIVVDVFVLVALSPLPAGLWVGVFDASIAWWLVLTVVQVTGGGPRWIGGHAEEWTAEELKGLKRSGWQHIDHVPLVGSDVDHVVVGPGGVFCLPPPACQEPRRPVQRPKRSQTRSQPCDALTPCGWRNGSRMGVTQQHGMDA